VAIVNGRITEKSFSGYRSFRHLLPQLERLTLICAQDEEYRQRFLRLGVDPRRVVLSGNIKADALKLGRAEPGAELRSLLGGAPGQAVLVAGSTHEPEERWIVEAWRALEPRPRLIVVPRHPQRCAEVCAGLERLGERPQRLTRLRNGGEAPDVRRVAIVDTIGELERVYSLAHLAFVGGSLVPHGGQNVLEPAAQGVPVVHGRWTANFAKEVALLAGAGASLEVDEPGALGGALAELLADSGRRAQMGQAGLRAVERTRGATERTIAALRCCLE
jgi:3-deoxy-D-manno-octulosonic-acid transferase